MTTGLLLVLSFYQVKNASTKSAPAGKQEVNTGKLTSLSFEPHILRLGADDLHKKNVVQISIDTQKNEVSQVQLELKFDPNSIKLVDVSPATGSALLTGGYGVIYKNINNESGRASFFISFYHSLYMRSGSIARLAFVPYTASTSSSIIFLDKTMVTAPNLPISVLKKSIPLTISF